MCPFSWHFLLTRSILCCLIILLSYYLLIKTKVQVSLQLAGNDPKDVFQGWPQCWRRIETGIDVSLKNTSVKVNHMKNVEWLFEELIHVGWRAWWAKRILAVGGAHPLTHHGRLSRGERADRRDQREEEADHWGDCVGEQVWHQPVLWAKR